MTGAPETAGLAGTGGAEPLPDRRSRRATRPREREGLWCGARRDAGRGRTRSRHALPRSQRLVREPRRRRSGRGPHGDPRAGAAATSMRATRTPGLHQPREGCRRVDRAPARAGRRARRRARGGRRGDRPARHHRPRRTPSSPTPVATTSWSSTGLRPPGAPAASWSPYGLRVAHRSTRARVEEATDAEIRVVALGLRDALRRLQAALGDVPYNVIIRTAPPVDPRARSTGTSTCCRARRSSPGSSKGRGSWSTRPARARRGPVARRGGVVARQ